MLADRALLVDLTIHKWEGRKSAPDLTREIVDAHGITGNKMANVRKSLLRRAAFERTNKIAQDARADHKRLTVAWMDSSVRALSSAGYWDYCAIMQGHLDAWALAVPAFLSAYDAERTEAEILLGTAFNVADYPSTGAVESKFGMHITKMAFPDLTDFRLTGMDASDIAAIRAECETEITARLQGGLSETAGRIVALLAGGTDPFGKVHRGLIPACREYDGTRAGRFNDGRVDDIRELTALLPALNLSNDAGMDAIIDRLNTDILSVTPDALRDDAAVRDATIARADAILADLAGFI